MNTRRRAPRPRLSPFPAPPVLRTVASVASLLLSYGLLLLANGLFSTLLGVRTQIEGFATEVVGGIVAGYFLGFLAGALLAVRVVAAVGHIRAFAAFASVMSVTALLHVLWVDPLGWFVLRLGAGYCMAGMIMVTESWLNERATNRTRGQVFSLYMVTNYFAAGCGQFLLPLADPGEFHLFSAASILFSLALIPVLLSRASAPMPVTPHPTRLAALYRTSPMALAGALAAGLVNASFFGLAPVFAHAIGLSVGQISVLMGSAILGGLTLQWPVGWLSDRLDRRQVLTGVAVLTALACALIATLTSQGGAALYAAVTLYGGLSFTLYSLSAAHANDFAPADKLIQTTSGLLIVYGLGASTGPVLAALAMGHAGPRGLFLFSAAVNILLAVYAVHRMGQRASRPRGARTPYPNLPGSQLTVEELYTAMRDARDRDLARLSGR